MKDHFLWILDDKKGSQSRLRSWKRPFQPEQMSGEKVMRPEQILCFADTKRRAAGSLTQMLNKRSWIWLSDQSAVFVSGSLSIITYGCLWQARSWLIWGVGLLKECCALGLTVNGQPFLLMEPHSSGFGSLCWAPALWRAVSGVFFRLHGSCYNLALQFSYV